MTRILSLLFGYFVYVAMYIKFQHPNIPYIGYIDNYFFLYKIVGTVVAVILGIGFLLMGLVLKEDSTTAKVEDRDKFIKSLKKINSEFTKIRYKISQIMSIAGSLFSFIFLGDYYLGAVIGIGAMISTAFISRIKDFFERLRQKAGIDEQ